MASHKDRYGPKLLSGRGGFFAGSMSFVVLPNDVA